MSTESHQKAMIDYARNFLKLRSKEILFLDETGFNLHTSNNYGYSEKGVSPVLFVPPSKGQNLSACCIISRSGLLSYELIDGGFNGEAFMNFIVSNINSGVLKKNSILVLDNAPIHKTTVLKEFLQARGVIVNFLPPYSPDLNPIENFFSALKARVNSKRPRPTTRNELKNIVIEILEDFKENENSNFFNRLVEKMWSLVYNLISNDC